MRKRDRRSMHTVGVIKDALIERMQTRAYSDLSVAELCRAAQISRGTFYLHFQNIAEVLDAVLDDILGELNNPYGAAENGCRLPLCRLIREHGAYRRILTDGALTAQIVDRLIALHEAEFWRRCGQGRGFATRNCARCSAFSSTVASPSASAICI